MTTNRKFRAFLFAVALVPLSTNSHARIIDTVSGRHSTSVSVLSANINDSFGVAVDDSGNLLALMRNGDRVFKIDELDQIAIVTRISTPDFKEDGENAAASGVKALSGVGAGSWSGGGFCRRPFSADTKNNRIGRKNNTTEIITAAVENGKSMLSKRFGLLSESGRS